MSDLVLSIVSIYYIQWHQEVINQNTGGATVSEEEKLFRLVNNMENAIQFKF